MEPAEIDIERLEDGSLRIIYRCLKTDTWHDFLGFKEDALAARDRDDIKAYQRYVRAGLWSIFAHLQAVVAEVEDSFRLGDSRGLTLTQRMRRIAQRTGVRKLNMSPGLQLRNILTHPGSSEKSWEEELNQLHTYEKVDLAQLDRVENQISPWIDAVCDACGIERLVDGFLADIEREMGGPTTVTGRY